MENENPVDADLVEKASPFASAVQRIGTVNDAKKMVEKMLVTFQKTLASDPMATTKFLRMGVQYLSANPALLDCDQLSFILCLMQCAELGLMPGPTTGHAYLIPFERRGQLPQVTLIPGYQGYVHCLYRSGRVDSISASAVWDGDEFAFRKGSDEFLHHIPKGAEDVLTHAYFLVYLKGSTRPIFWVVNQAQADKARKASKSGFSQYSPWTKNPAPMWVKTGVRRLRPFLPLNYELRSLLDLDARDDEPTGMRQATLSGSGFVSPVAPAEDEPPKALPERASEPVTTERANRRSRATVDLPRPAPEAPEGRLGSVAPEPPPEASKSNTAPAREPADPQGLMSRAVDLVAAIADRGGNATIPKDLERMTITQLRAMVNRLEGELALLE